MSKFNTKNASAKTINLAGGKAFRMSAEVELMHAVLTTFLEDKFYESGDARLQRIIKLIGECNPIFVAQLAVVARDEFNMRSVSHALLGHLSKIHNGDDLLMKAIVRCAIRPDDLTEIASFVGTPMPKQVKRGIRHALLKFNRYQLAKYREEGKAISLVDLFNLTHPNPKFADKEQKKAWKDLMTGKLISEDTWESEISTAKDDKSRTKEWERLVKEDKMGYMAMLRNLNNFIKYGVSDITIRKVVKKLTTAEEVKKSRQLPFRFLTAYKNVAGNREFTDAISDAMDIAVDNVPILKGSTLIAVDSSGSMSGEPMEKASIFAATLIKANAKANVVLYDTQIKDFVTPTKSPVLSIAEKIQGQAMGGGTHTGLVFATAKLYDRIIIISDNESWASNTQKDYTDYKKRTGADPFVYAIDIQGYGSTDLSGGKIFHLTGWSDKLLDFVGKIEEGETLLKHVKSVEL